MSFTVSEKVDINGTCLQGYVSATRRKIQSVFGKPTLKGYRHDKVTTEWAIQFDDGLVATLYDYKRYSAGSPKMDEEYGWHIGGHDRAAVDRVRETLESGEWRLI